MLLLFQYSCQCHARLDPLENTAESCCQIIAKLKRERTAESFSYSWYFSWDKKSGIFMIIFVMLTLINVIRQLHIMLWLHYFGLAGSGSTLFWSQCWICCRCHLAALVLDHLQCRSCVFFSLSLTHTPAVPAAESRGWVQHARCSPEASYHLLSTPFGLCSSDDPSQLRMTGTERREDVWERRGRCVLKIKWGHAQSLWHVSAHRQSALLLFSATSCLLFLGVFNNLL